MFVGRGVDGGGEIRKWVRWWIVGRSQQYGATRIMFVGRGGEIRKGVVGGLVEGVNIW